MSGLVFVSRETCARVLDPASIARRVEEAFGWENAGRVILSSPHVLTMRHPVIGETADGHGAFKTKGAILPDLGVVGFRLGGSRFHPDGTLAGSQDATRLVLLVDLGSAAPLALVDEYYNFRMRTAASVAVAAVPLAPQRPRLGIVGVGEIGRTVARMFAVTLDLESIVVTSRRAETREAFVAEFADELDITAVDSVDELAERSNVIVTITTTSKPFLSKEHIRPGSLICALGKYELEPDCYFAVDKLVVDDWEQTRNALDLRAMVADGTLRPEHIYAESHEVVTGAKVGRADPDEIILLRSEGIGSHDVALAHLAYTRAVELEPLLELR
jgi:alanine dehydrogenase